ncbi:MAG TPA: FtsX-like permease family protein [Verrucomicrobiota bacterium]|nr:hypothetical protein [Verrucomicrobiales bacterium]HRI15165.1 FtsX-like permease family protein [Verrucomicrobiota bacterium]
MRRGPLQLLPLLWSRFTWRHWRLAPVQSVLLMSIVALGVAVFFAIRLANRAVVSSFQNFTDLITAESDGLISAPAGMLPESALTELRAALEDTAVQIIPVLETTAARPRTQQVEAIGTRGTFHLLGVDLIAVQNLVSQRHTDRRWWGQTPAGRSEPSGTNSNADFWQRFRDPTAAFISEALAQRDALNVGSPLGLIINESIVTLKVAGIIPNDPGRPQTPANFIVMDLPALEHLVDLTGRLSRIEFVMEDGPQRAERWARLRAQLEALAQVSPNQTTLSAPRWIVASPADRRASGEVMTRAFRLNLTILSLLALLVGLYLIFQALDGAVVRRREEIAILRSLGVTSRTIQHAWLLEAAVLGIVGGALGLLLGWAGAQGAVRLVGRTVNALYYATSAESADLHWGEALLALFVATVSSVLAGWWPAKSAAATPPAQSMGRGHATTFAGPTVLRRMGLAIMLAVVGVGLLAFPPVRLGGGTRIPVAAYLAALVWIFAAGIFGGGALKHIAWWSERGIRSLTNSSSSTAALGRGTRSMHRENSFEADTGFSFSAVLRVALSHLREPSGRHRLAVAGLVCAVAMTAGMAILVGSFDVTMRGWITRTFQADLYVSSDGAQSASTENRISPATWRALLAHPSVARAQIVQVARVQLPEGETLLAGADLAFFREVARPAWREAPRDDAAFDTNRNANLVLVSEAFSERFKRRRGDSLIVPTPNGARELTIAGVFSDYGNERGSILVDRGQFVRGFGDELASSVIMVLRPGSDVEAIRSELRAAHPGLAVFTQSYLRGEALRIFRQTFAITYALELIGVVVAVAGLALAMVSLLWERRGDLTTMRALGFRRRELAAAAALECLLTAVSGVGIGLLASLALGWLLIHRINQQTFGWTLQTDWSWLVLGALAATVMVAAAGASWWAGRWGAQLPAEQEE